MSDFDDNPIRTLVRALNSRKRPDPSWSVCASMTTIEAVDGEDQLRRIVLSRHAMASDLDALYARWAAVDSSAQAHLDSLRSARRAEVDRLSGLARYRRMWTDGFYAWNGRRDRYKNPVCKPYIASRCRLEDVRGYVIKRDTIAVYLDQEWIDLESTSPLCAAEASQAKEAAEALCEYTFRDNFFKLNLPLPTLRDLIGGDPRITTW